MDARTEHRNSRRSPTPLSCDRLFYGGEMDILSALKNEASKLQKQLDTVHAAIKVFGGRDGVGRGKKRRLSPSARARKIGRASGRERGWGCEGGGTG